GAAVRNQLRVGLLDLDHVIRQVEGVSGDLREDGVGALADLGTGGQDADLSGSGRLDGDLRLQEPFSRTGESRAVQKGSEANAALRAPAAAVVSGEGGAFPVVVSELQGAVHELRQGYPLTHHLPGGCRLTLPQEVTPPHRLRRKAHARRDAVHVPL